MLRIGIVGGGHIVRHRHLPAFKKMSDVELVAICDVVESDARDVAKRFGIKHYFTRLLDMLKQEPDVVDICTPPQTHFDLAMQAIEHGCHVLVEKPMAMTVREVDEMFQASRKKAVKLSVVHQNLFNPVVRKAVELYESGALGDLISVEAGTFMRRENAMRSNPEHWCHKLPGGIFFEVLPHPVYLLQIFLREITPVFVLAKRRSHAAWMRADEVRVLADAGNSIGSLSASCSSPIHGDTLDIIGTDLRLQVDLWGRSLIAHRQRTESPVSVGKNNLDLTLQSLSLLRSTISSFITLAFGGVKISAHYGFLSAFVRSIQYDDEPPVTEEATKENVRIVSAICQDIDRSRSSA